MLVTGPADGVTTCETARCQGPDSNESGPSSSSGCSGHPGPGPPPLVAQAHLTRGPPRARRAAQREDDQGHHRPRRPDPVAARDERVAMEGGGDGGLRGQHGDDQADVHGGQGVPPVLPAPGLAPRG